MIHFYGPYSEGVQSDIGLLETFGFVEEKEQLKQDGSSYFVLNATQAATSLAERPEVKKFKPAIQTMNDADPVVLELAATYDAFREMGHDHKSALERLKRKKGVKCEEGRTEKALELLKKLKLKPS
ncbi:MAG: hypothetical protein U0132_24125 [Gemmatimonadaceae bacterium]